MTFLKILKEWMVSIYGLIVSVCKHMFKVNNLSMKENLSTRCPSPGFKSLCLSGISSQTDADFLSKLKDCRETRYKKVTCNGHNISKVNQ